MTERAYYIAYHHSPRDICLRFCRDDIDYITDGGIGKQETNPQITFDSGSDPDPIDITGDITNPTSYEAPTFNIIAMIKVKN